MHECEANHYFESYCMYIWQQSDECPKQFGYKRKTNQAKYDIQADVIDVLFLRSFEQPL